MPTLASWCPSAGLALVLLSFAWAQAETLDDIASAGKERIAIDVAIAPFGMADDEMRPTGSDVETARLLAKDHGVKLETGG
jgi:polar amino acid transport system substrate-binding protein